MNSYRRLSGAAASALSVWRLRIDATMQQRLLGLTLSPRQIRRVTLMHEDGANVLDDAIAAALDDEAIEVSLHGGLGVARAWEQRLMSAGCRPAAHDEWHDLPTDELLAARSPLAARVAWASRDYELQLQRAQTKGDSEAVAFARQRLPFRGLTHWLERPPKIALIGPTNAGKSSLLNALLREERVTVSPHPGTTRDAVEASVQIGHECDALEWTWVDTAGLWEDAHGVDRLAVRRSAEVAASAWLRVWVLDITRTPSDELRGWLRTAEPRDVLLWNHSDRGISSECDELSEQWSGAVLRGSAKHEPTQLVHQLERACLACLPPLPPPGLALPQNAPQWSELEAIGQRCG